MKTLSPRTSAVRVAVFSLLAGVAPLAAQQPYGRATVGSGAWAPRLSAPQPRGGDATFAFDLQCANGSSPAFMFLATAPGSLRILGVDLNVDPTTVAASWSGFTSAGGPGDGRTTFPLPIPVIPSLVGFPLYAQALVIDTAAAGGIAASRGLRFAVAGVPSIFVACSIIGNDPFQLVDPIGGAILDTGAPPEVDNVTGAEFDLAGDRVFTASSIRGIIGVGDTSSLPITWSTLYTSPASSTYGVQLDRARQLCWTLTAIGGGSRELVAIDVDRTSPTYGAAVHTTVSMLTGNAEIWDLAPSGDVAAVLTYLPNSITIVATDPASPTFLQNRFTQLTIPVDQAGPLTLATRVAITPDERYALVTLQGVGTTPAEIARLDLATGSWVDHDPAGFATNIGPFSVPPIVMGSAPTSLQVSGDGRYAIVGGFGGCGWVGRLDLDPKNPLAVTYTAFAPGVPLANGWTAALSNDEKEICIPTWPRTGCALSAPQLVRLDARTGTLLSTIPIPPNTNGSNQNLYTCVYR
ncbi:MAG: hypothetical protein IPM29_20550 [Planctomycetes bacterium]|nr:hypothetical protein [Planctomycetota bacterium]